MIFAQQICHRYFWERGISFCFFVCFSLFLFGCLDNPGIRAVIPGCEDCPDRCLFSVNENEGRCAACLTNQHCRKTSLSRQVCINNECVCGSDEDCKESSTRPYCTLKGCSECRLNEHCTDKEKPFCSLQTYQCVPCQVGQKQACSPTSDGAVCKKGEQTCLANFTWSPCKGTLICKEGEMCIEESCYKDCPKPSLCKGDEVQCTSKGKHTPGMFRVCEENAFGCMVWSKERACGEGEYCKDGECIFALCDEAACNIGDVKCDGTDGQRVCMKNRDGCLVWSQKKACPTGVKCVAEKGTCGICKPTETKACYTGPKGTNKQGECKSGVQTCKADGSGWDTCEKQHLPTKEICNDKDDDCDGQTDEDFPKKGQTCEVGVGLCQQQGTYLCSQSAKEVACNVSPGSPKLEECNGKDDDCDGFADNTKGKSTVLERDCFGGDASLLGKGTCKAGKQICEKGSWSACVGEVNPVKEICDGKDNDCDGKVDNQAGSKDAIEQTCYSGGRGTQGKGACKDGKSLCKQGKWSICQHETLPTKESCNDKDDDCDGKTDEDFLLKGKACSLGVGGCKKESVWTCSTDQSKLECDVQPSSPTKEVCDGKDNDCDGKVDNQENSSQLLLQSCFSGTSQQKGVGTCASGRQVCTQGKWSSCEGEVKPTTDICDDKDNDCDGQVDEDFPQKGKSCSVGLGECKKSSVYVCKNDGTDVDCPTFQGASSTEVCDGKDNDCDGKVDNQSGSSASITKKCYSGTQNTRQIGQCQDGKSLCQGGTWSSCQGETKPSTEVCDDKDNDCDGQIDETFTQKGKLCSVGIGGCLRAGIFRCASHQQDVECPASKGSPTTEVCNGKDDDCDGKTDNQQNSGQPLQQPCYAGLVGTKGVGTCKEGVSSCHEGVWSLCQGQVSPQNESCNGKDDDCDGKTDNQSGTSLSLTRGCYTGKPGTQGIGECKTGTQTCGSGSWSTCQREVIPASELCNGKDDDCNGKIDESSQAGVDTVCNVCGDTKLGPNEDCDDGNKDSKDGCSSSCLWELGSRKKPAVNCKNILDAGLSRGNGFYWLKLSDDMAEPYLGYCEMVTKDGGWTLVGREKANNKQHLNYWDHTNGEPTKVSNGSESGMFGPELKGNYNKEYLLFWKQKNSSNQLVDTWVYFKTSQDIFSNDRTAINFGVTVVDSNAPEFTTLFNPRYGYTFCRANRWGVREQKGVSWALRSSRYLSHFGCGCTKNNTSWASQGIFYGGSTKEKYLNPGDDSCSTSIETGGGFVGFSTIGKVKGNVTFPQDLLIYAR